MILIRKSLSAFLAVLLTITSIPTRGLAAIPGSSIATIETSVPLSLATPRESFVGSNTQSPKVILIEDLHGHYGVQQNIAKILAHINRRLGQPFIVGVEGFSGPIDLSEITSFKDTTVREMACRYLMREAEMTGAEYYAAVSGLPQSLYGIEEEEAYNLHRDVFRRSYSVRGNLSHDLTRLEQHLEKLEGTFHTRAVQRIDHYEKAYLDGRLDEGSYRRKLQAQARPLGISIGEDLSFAADRLKIAAARTSSERDVLQVLTDVRLVGRVISLQSTEDEVRAFAPRIGNFVALLEKVLDGPASLKPEDLRSAVTAALDYYSVALVRNKPMIEHALAYSAAQKSPITVLVTGGFHTRGLVALLKERGISYSILTPQISEYTEADHQLYVERLLGHYLTDSEIINSAPSVALVTSKAPALNSAIAIGQTPLLKHFRLAALVIGAALAGTTVSSYWPHFIQDFVVPLAEPLKKTLLTSAGLGIGAIGFLAAVLPTPGMHDADENGNGNGNGNGQVIETDGVTTTGLTSNARFDSIPVEEKVVNPNFIAFADVPHELAEMRKSHDNVSFVFTDIDYLRSFNLAFGQNDVDTHFRDPLLGINKRREANANYQEALIHQIIVSVYPDAKWALKGGDEIILLIPDDTAAAAAVVNKLRIAFKNLLAHPEHKDVPMTLSSGVVALRELDLTPAKHDEAAVVEIAMNEAARRLDAAKSLPRRGGQIKDYVWSGPVSTDLVSSEENTPATISPYRPFDDPAWDLNDPLLSIVRHSVEPTNSEEPTGILWDAFQNIHFYKPDEMEQWRQTIESKASVNHRIVLTGSVSSFYSGELLDEAKNELLKSGRSYLHGLGFKVWNTLDPDHHAGDLVIRGVMSEIPGGLLQAIEKLPKDWQGELHIIRGPPDTVYFALVSNIDVTASGYAVPRTKEISSVEKTLNESFKSAHTTFSKVLRDKLKVRQIGVVKTFIPPTPSPADADYRSKVHGAFAEGIYPSIASMQIWQSEHEIEGDVLLKFLRPGKKSLTDGQLGFVEGVVALNRNQALDNIRSPERLKSLRKEPTPAGIVAPKILVQSSPRGRVNKVTGILSAVPLLWLTGEFDSSLRLSLLAIGLFALGASLLMPRLLQGVRTLVGKILGDTMPKVEKAQLLGLVARAVEATRSIRMPESVMNHVFMRGATANLSTRVSEQAAMLMRRSA